MFRTTNKIYESKDIIFDLIFKFGSFDPNERERLLLNISKNNEFSGYIARALSDNFLDISIEVRHTLIFNLINFERAIPEILKILRKYYAKLPKEIFYYIIINLAKYEDDPSVEVARFIWDKLEDININIRNELILELASHEDSSIEVLKMIYEKFELFSDEDIEKILLKITEFEESSLFLIGLLKNSDFFSRIPYQLINNILKKIVEYDKVKEKLSEIILVYFEQIDFNLNEELLIKISNEDQAVEHILEILKVRSQLFDITFLENVFKNIIKTLSNSKVQNSFDVLADYLSNKFEEIPSKIRNNLLLELSEHKEVGYIIADILYNYYEKIPENIRQKIIINLPFDEKINNILKEIYEINFLEIQLDKYLEEIRNYISIDIQKDLFLSSEETNFSGILSSVRKFIEKLIKNIASEKIKDFNRITNYKIIKRLREINVISENQEKNLLFLNGYGNIGSHNTPISLSFRERIMLVLALSQVIDEILFTD